MALLLSSKELKLPLYVIVLLCLFVCFIFVWLHDGFLMRERKKKHGFGRVWGEDDQGGLGEEKPWYEYIMWKKIYLSVKLKRQVEFQIIELYPPEIALIIFLLVLI